MVDRTASNVEYLSIDDVTEMEFEMYFHAKTPSKIKTPR